ncbi:MAG: hypothetical protein V3T23_00305 [Nitrososphaerales archaeon]
MIQQVTGVLADPTGSGASQFGRRADNGLSQVPQFARVPLLVPAADESDHRYRDVSETG